MPATTKKLKFEWIPHHHFGPAHNFPWGGNMQILTCDGRKLCDYVHWGFASCGSDLLQNFKSYYYDPAFHQATHPFYQMSNTDILNKHHEELVTFLKENAPGVWHPKELLFLLSTTQKQQLKEFLENEHIKRIDRFLNKAHGPNHLYLYRLSCNKDFKQ